MAFTDAQIELTDSKLAAREGAALVTIKGKELLGDVVRLVAILIRGMADK